MKWVMALILACYSVTVPIVPAFGNILNDQKNHPLVYKAMAPGRKLWHGVVWLDEKTKPAQPLFDVMGRLGAMGSVATPFMVGFLTR